MKFFSHLVVCVLLANFSVACAAAAEEEEDGYKLLKQAAASVKRDDVSKIILCVKNREYPSQEVNNILEKYSDLISILKKSLSCKKWNIPAIEGSRDVVVFSNFHSFSVVVSAFSNKMLSENNPLASFECLSDYKKMGFKIMSSGGTIDFCTLNKDFYMMLPSFTSTIDMIPVEKLNECFDEMKYDYRCIPKPSTVFHGDILYMQSSIVGTFSSWEKSDEVKKYKKEIQDRMRSIDSASSLTIFPVHEWQQNTLKMLTMLEQPIYDKIDAVVANQEIIGKFAEESCQRFNNILPGFAEYDAYFGKGRKLEEDTIADLLKMAKADTINEISCLSKKIGDRMNYFMLHTACSDGMMLIRYYQRRIGSERLLLIRIASRIYKQKNGCWPKSWDQLIAGGLLDREMITDPTTGKIFNLRVARNGNPEAYFVSRLDEQSSAKEFVLEPLKGR